MPKESQAIIDRMAANGLLDGASFEQYTRNNQIYKVAQGLSQDEAGSSGVRAQNSQKGAPKTLQDCLRESQEENRLKLSRGFRTLSKLEQSPTVVKFLGQIAKRTSVIHQGEVHNHIKKEKEAMDAIGKVEGKGPVST